MQITIKPPIWGIIIVYFFEASYANPRNGEMACVFESLGKVKQKRMMKHTNIEFKGILAARPPKLPPQ